MFCKSQRLILNGLTTKCFILQARECTVLPSGYVTTGTTDARQPFGPLASYCTTWCAETSRLSTTRRYWEDGSFSGEESRQVWFDPEIRQPTDVNSPAFCLWIRSLTLLFVFCLSVCQQLIKWCLCLRPSDRPTLEQIFEHQWMRMEESPKAESGDITLHAISTESGKESLWRIRGRRVNGLWDLFALVPSLLVIRTLVYVA